MDNLLRVSLIVLFCTIVVMFSGEFKALFKKIFAIRGVKLFLPLLLVTHLIVSFEGWVFWVLLEAQTILLALVGELSRWLPFQTGAVYVATSLILMSLSIFPVLAINVWIKRKRYRTFQYSYLTNTFIWLLLVILLILGRPY